MTRFLPLVLAAVLAAGAASAEPSPAPTAPKAGAPTSGADFLARNAREPGVQTLPSGLQYKVVAGAPAGGASPRLGDFIKVHYEGKLVSGAVFDSSFDRGKPVIMPLGGLVPAWMEALPRMKVGEEWVLYAPPELGYGPEGAGPIPPNSVLIFRVKLLGMLSAD